MTSAAAQGNEWARRPTGADGPTYVKAVIRKALEDGDCLSAERCTDLADAVYGMLVAGNMLTVEWLVS